jgi:MscS family membrane protein
MLLTTMLGLRYETTHDQLRFLLTELRELLHAHPRVILSKRVPLLVRFAGFGDFTPNVQVRAYIQTTSRQEFHGIQDDIFLRCMRIVKQAGTSFAFPSHTLYYTGDSGLDQERQRKED